ncbi:MAG: hypothetical protein ABI990_10510 [Actinomycetota bacterium]
MKKPPSRRRVEKMRERERSVGLEPDDPAGQWLDEHAPRVPFEAPKSAKKSKLLHQWKQAQQKRKH